MKDKSDISISEIFLLDNLSGEIVEAELWDAIIEKNLADWEAEWTPYLLAMLQSLHRKGISRKLWPQSRRWNWSDKVKALEGRLSNQCFAVMCKDVTQAMMITDLTHRARLQRQRNAHLVYVDYLEVAPWNRGELTGQPPSFSGGGSILVRAAVEFSMQEGFHGRIGLHSLPQSNDFYSNRIGMSDLGKDEHYQDLRYFEMTEEQVENFLMEGEKS